MEMTETYEQGKSLTVLLVDDQRMLVNLGRSIIEKHQKQNYFAAPCTTIAFTNPTEAVEMLGSIDDLAVVVSDFNMPGMNGEQLLAKVREMHPDAIRIISSANPYFRQQIRDPEVAHASLEKNPRTYVESLVRVVNTSLKAYLLGEASVNP